ncbi:MAG: MlaD family protein [Thermodesulfobacteriota bacterium]
MSSKANNFKIGLFILIGMIVTVIGIILFGGGKFFREKYTIETYFDQSVQGLDVGAPLIFYGVQIGDVNDIHFVFNDYKTNKQYVLVRANIYPDLVRGGGGRRLADKYDDIGVFLKELVKNGLRLELASQGITGVAFLNMVYSEPDKFPAFDIEWKPEYPYIPSKPGTITIITEAIENLSVDMDKLVLELRESVKDANIAKISTDLDKLLNNLDRTSMNINTILESEEVGSSLKHLSNTLANIDKSTTNLPQTLSELSKIMLNIKRLTLRQQQDIDNILENITATTQNLTEMLDTGKRQPSWILFGNPPPKIHEVSE